MHAQSTGWVSNQLAYHLLWRAVEFDITAACAESDLGILCYSPLQQGLLTGRFTNPAEVPAGRSRTRHFGNRQKMSRHETEGHEALTFATIDRLRSLAADLRHPMADVALAWLLQQRGVRSVISEPAPPNKSAANTRAASLTLDAATLAALDLATLDLKQALGPNADLWAAKTRGI